MARLMLFQLRSKVSRRILLTVLLCSLVPIGALVGMTLYNVQNRLETDAQQRLRHAGKTIGMALFAELSALEDEIRKRAGVADGSSSDLLWPSGGRQTPLRRVWFIADSSGYPSAPELTPRIAERLSDGLSYLDCSGTNHQTAMYLWIPSTGTQGRRGGAVAELNPEYLWNHALGFLPQNAELLVIDRHNRPAILYQTSEFPRSSVHAAASADTAELLKLRLGGEAWVMAGWDLFLKAGFSTLGWRIIVTEPKKQAFAGLFDFRRNAFLAAVMTFCTVLLASSILVRQTLNPLKELKEATRRISRGDFDLRLQIDSGDEFQILGESFNRMSGRIQQQIVYQKHLGLAVRQVLGAETEEEAIRGFFNGLASTLPCHRAGLLIYQLTLKRPADFWDTSLRGVVRPRRTRVDRYDQAGLKALNQSGEMFVYAGGGDFPTLIPNFEAFASEHVWLFPLEISVDRQAVLMIADRERVPGEDQLNGVRQMVDQLGVALNRIAMTKDLQSMNIGTLTALARAVDANSPWTHGHSERVTEYALLIARELGFSEEDRNALHRAGLLHDLGKVSIPSVVLNKPGKLTDDEYRLMQGHPAEGERIIEPIQAFSGIGKIIRQHHERWDGKGYPDGLSDEQIHPGARVMAVADVYDALYSDRPYREGWPQEKVLNFLREESGKMFEPAVVDAFLKLLEKDTLELVMSSLAERQAS